MAKKKNPRSKPRRDLYQEVTDKILDSLDQGVAPWRSPIVHDGDGPPKSLSTGTAYRGINTFLLAMVSWAEGYGSDYWMTFNQAKSRSGQVRKGEKGALVCIATHTIGDQPGRFEPRQVKRRLKRFHWMMLPRQETKLQLLKELR